MKTGGTDRVTNCARGPLHLRRAALISFWNPTFSTLLFGCSGFARASPPFVYVFVRSLRLTAPRI